jgi:hypothetical protein
VQFFESGKSEKGEKTLGFFTLNHYNADLSDTREFLDTDLTGFGGRSGGSFRAPSTGNRFFFQFAFSCDLFVLRLRAVDVMGGLFVKTRVLFWADSSRSLFLATKIDLCSSLFSIKLFISLSNLAIKALFDLE